MTRRALLPVLALAFIATVPSAVPAAPAAADGVHDVGELMAAARAWVDLESMDAVVLLESRSIELRPGERTTTFHEIVWISTELGIERYADLRVPYDSATSTLEVTALRTWMDGRWWPHERELNPTAIVETIPFAIQSADDYTNMRETMLLHDGVEIPCIMETVYRITERRPAGTAADGLWIFPGDDPAVQVVYSVSAPSGSPFSFAAANGAPDPIVVETNGGTFTTRTWSMRTVGRLPRPLTPDPASHQPHVVWSTWGSWGELGDRFSANLDGTLALSVELADTLTKRLEHVPTLEAKADEVAAFIRETTRSVNYDDRFWRFAPRAASRTWETAYGHRLDRAVLATALFQEAGCGTDLIFRAAEGAVVDAAVPGLSRFEGVSLRVRGNRSDSFAAFFDPSSGALTHGLSPLARRTVWSHIGSSEPHVGYGPEGFENGELRLELTLEPKDEGGWTGTCFFDARGTLSPHASLVGLGDESSSYLGRVVSSVLDGADMTEYNLRSNPRTCGAARCSPSRPPRRTISEGPSSRSAIRRAAPLRACLPTSASITSSASRGSCPTPS